jgi:hypothetical protein
MPSDELERNLEEAVVSLFKIFHYMHEEREENCKISIMEAGLPAEISSETSKI